MNKRKLLYTHFWTGIAFTIAYFLLYYYADLPIDIWVHNTLQGSTFQQFCIVLGEIFEPKYWVLVMILALISGLLLGTNTKHKKLRKTLLILGLSLLIATVIGTLLKYFFGRYRPVEFFEHARYGFHFFSTKHSLNSTPSGHSYSIFAAMTALSICFRRYTVLFILLAVIVALSRIVALAHYPADVLFGAYIGIFSALYVRAFLITQ